MTFIKKLEESLKLNQNYLFLLAIFNGAIVMNFHKLIYKNPLIMLGLLTFLIITIIDYKKWWSVIFNSFINGITRQNTILKAKPIYSII